MTGHAHTWEPYHDAPGTERCTSCGTERPAQMATAHSADTVNGLRPDLHDPDCPGMDEDGNWFGPCDCAAASALSGEIEPIQGESEAGEVVRRWLR